MKRDNAKLVVFNRSGHTIYLGQQRRISGYRTPDDPPLPSADLDIPDDTPALDIVRAVDTVDGFRMVIRGPMVDVDLPTGEIAYCPTPSPIMAGAMMGDNGNAFGQLLALQAVTEKPGPLDSVCIAEYLERWREAGARIGRYLSGKITWEG